MKGRKNEKIRQRIKGRENMYLYKLEYDMFGSPISIRFHIDNKEIIFQKVLKLINGEKIKTVEKIAVLIYGKVITDNDDDFWISETVFKKIKKIAIEKLIKEARIIYEFACPYCGYIDPNLMNLYEAKRMNEIRGRGYTCPQCGRNFTIPDIRPLYWGKSSGKPNRGKRKQKKHKAG